MTVADELSWRLSFGSSYQGETLGTLTQACCALHGCTAARTPGLSRRELLAESTDLMVRNAAHSSDYHPQHGDE
jgi:hypothetical protein